MSEQASAPTITIYPNGPLVVRGDVTLQGLDGEPVERHHDAVALCRCGLSKIKPYCDGTHKRSKFHD